MDLTTPEVSFADDRGTITDLAEETISAVSRVRTNAGAVRGNHLHKQTTQWTYVVHGLLRVTTDTATVDVRPGEMVVNPPGEPHAWEALEDTECIVFAAGPRAGRNYESDTYRLADPLVAR